MNKRVVAKALVPPQPRNHKGFGGRRAMRAELDALRAFTEDVINQLPSGYASISKHFLDLQEAVANEERRRERLATEIKGLKKDREELRSEIVDLRDTVILQEVGVYEYSHPMESSTHYKEKLDELRSGIKALAKDGAVTAVAGWTVNGSAAKGRKMVRDMSKLLLRAYNNEATSLVSKLRPFRLEAAIARLDRSRNAINRLGAQPMSIAITSRYHRLRVKELRLTADWLAKKHEEKEAAKAERQRLREEVKALKEIEAERKRLLKERSHYEKTLAKLRSSGGNPDELAELEASLAEIDEAMSTVEKRAANTRAGHVYVISNIGSLGEQMVKIGMTRRLEPMLRVRELGDASVPFLYDLHVLIFSEDAVSLEKELHDRFADRRVNLVNMRREFFYVTPGEVKRALDEISDRAEFITDFVETPEAVEWHLSENTRRDRISAAGLP